MNCNILLDLTNDIITEITQVVIAKNPHILMSDNTLVLKIITIKMYILY